mgnify:CR=1 FL=1
MAAANSSFCFLVTTTAPESPSVQIKHAGALTTYKIQLIDGEGTHRICFTTPPTSPAPLTIEVTDINGEFATIRIISH